MREMDFNDALAILSNRAEDQKRKLETGQKYAVRCDNPDRPDSCGIGFYYSMHKNPEESIRRWNEFQEWPMEAREKWRDECQRQYWESII